MDNRILNFLAHGLVNGSFWQLVAYTLIMTHITIAGVTIYLHRSQAHRALDVHPLLSHFFRFWLWLTSGMVTSQWVAIHRKHHAKCETEEDPHSPQIRGIRKVLLEGAELYRSECANQETMTRYGYGTPNDWLEHNVYTKHSILGVSFMMIINLLLFGPIGLTIWAVQMAWIPFWAAGVVNGLAHYWGYRNYNCADASTNIFPLGIIIGGEELHNNHHTFATSAKLSSKWYEFDLGWMYIRILSMLGLAKIKRVAPVPKLGSAKPVLDFETLQAVLSNRYEVMSYYVKTLKQAYRQELAHLRAVALTKKCSRYALFKSARKWFHWDEESLDAPQKAQLPHILGSSAALRTFYELRIELSTLWERSTATREQLLQQLQDWCMRAEASGIKALQEFSWRLRRYA